MNYKCLYGISQGVIVEIGYVPDMRKARIHAGFSKQCTFVMKCLMKRMKYQRLPHIHRILLVSPFKRIINQSHLALSFYQKAEIHFAESRDAFLDPEKVILRLHRLCCTTEPVDQLPRSQEVNSLACYLQT